ncbi:hypothetical protein EDC14_101972 [Hydrogenispora ethanolica]|jgi:hypothetical protein|uniref:Uncharacterized protein n=1 Tax=Hydrogenispora ethanolica TaxID=1082276 RepID=A0A4R1REH0_HYDET|nr:hypothetical protein [Hydrogenispora ethanolica]TCL64266.1 hypothetical protein EDC14_101972 [Hydrogenispora ethanolica]
MILSGLSVLFIFSLIAALEVPGLLKKRYWKELIVYSFLLLAGLGLSLLLVAGVEIPPVSTAITNWVKAVFKIKG